MNRTGWVAVGALATITIEIALITWACIASDRAEQRRRTARLRDRQIDHAVLARMRADAWWESGLVTDDIVGHPV
jgi:hypothetical protein